MNGVVMNKFEAGETSECCKVSSKWDFFSGAKVG